MKPPDKSFSFEDILIRVCLSGIIIITPLLFFTKLTRIPYFIQGAVERILLVIILSLGLIKCLRKGKITLVPTQWNLPIASFLGVSLISLSWVFLRRPDVRYALSSCTLEGMLFYLLNWFLVFYIIIYTVRNNLNRELVINLFLTVAVVASAYGILQFFNLEPIWPEKVKPFSGRIISTFGNPDFLSSFLVVLLPLGMVKFLFARAKWKKFIYLGVVGTLLIALVFTTARAAWLGFGLCLPLFVGLFLYARRTAIVKQIITWGIIFLCMGGIAIGISPGRRQIFSRMSQVFRPREAGQALTQRLLIWHCSLDMFKEQPVVGQGPGTFELFYPYYQHKYLLQKKYHPLRTHGNAAHNEILQLLSEQGILGLGVWLWLFTVLFVFGIKSLKKLDFYKQGIMIGCLAGIFAFLIDNLLNVSFHFPSPVLAFFSVCGIAFVTGQTTTKTLTLHRKEAFSVLVGVTILFSGWLIRREINHFRGSIWYIKAQQSVLRKNHQKAIEAYKYSLKLDPTCVHTAYALGNTYASPGVADYEKAIDSYKEAWRINSGYDEIPYNLGAVYQRQGNLAEAVKWLEKSVYIKPNSIEGWRNLSTAYLGLGNLQEAIRCVQEAINLTPGDKELYNNLGYYYTQAGLIEEARESYQKALSLDPAYPLAKLNLQNLQKARITQPGKISNLQKQAKTYIELKNWVKAIQVCQEILKADRSNFVAHFYLGNIYYLQEKYQEASEAYKNAEKILPNHIGLHQNAGLNYLRLGEKEKAREEFLKVLRLDPDNETARDELAKSNP